ncbi:MAG TPA: hypothetical protein V6C65_40315 [Allocoleopsis sp.]
MVPGYDYADPFLTYIDLNASPAEVQRLMQRQALIESTLEGKESASTVLDCLAEQGVDPIAYVDSVEAAIGAAIAGGVLPENAPLLLQLRD